MFDYLIGCYDKYEAEWIGSAYPGELVDDNELHDDTEVDLSDDGPYVPEPEWEEQTIKDKIVDIWVHVGTVTTATFFRRIHTSDTNQVKNRTYWMDQNRWYRWADILHRAQLVISKRVI